MSETKDDFIYNYYDYISPIFIYPHVKTYLIDSKRQEIERWIDYILLIISSVLAALIVFKLFVIVVYFLLIRSLPQVFKFLINLCRFKCKINIASSCKNALFNIQKVGKRISTFNFYLYENKLIGFIMVLSYLLFLVSSALFFGFNVKELNSSEKSVHYMKTFYIHFESMLSTHLLCTSFYASRNMTLDTITAVVLFILLNVVLYMGYLIKEKIENVEGIFENKEPQLIMNSLFNFIFAFINIKSLLNAIFYDKKSKIILYKYHDFFYRGKLQITIERKG